MKQTDYEIAPQELEGNANNKGSIKELLMQKRRWLIPVLITVLIILTISVLLIVLLLEEEQVQHKGFRSILPDKKVCFDPGNETTYEKYTEVFNKMIAPYEQAKIEGNMINCDKRPPNEGEVCYFRASWLSFCNKESDWGFKASEPCMIFTLDKDRDFTPKPHLKSDVLPDEMPKDIREYIEEDLADHQGLVGVDCNHTPIYNPLPGFLQNFLYNNLTEYLPPLVAVSFDLSEKDQLDVECTLWSNTPEVNPFPKVSFQISKDC